MICLSFQECFRIILVKILLKIMEKVMLLMELLD